MRKSFLIIISVHVLKLEISGCDTMLFLHFLFSVGPATFCFNFLFFVIALHTIMHFSLTACRNLYRLETRPLAKMPPPY
jgi:predicted small secreted protein